MKTTRERMREGTLKGRAETGTTERRAAHLHVPLGIHPSSSTGRQSFISSPRDRAHPLRHTHRHVAGRQTDTL
ncbi:hypothetical protein IscW_ISCW021349 [Ixodes scapularis]|uniref:Uncharacterized protein n=1 Tax=Ixodes scapularis TaxID=6945 RepID=B7Q572_IXOSC|nr:hypothetical protein IscW_ISCW021349 [Ixodes scapularis]|eukprot:XP_002411701.1 hypothetical protein IscW_ISCW021349 [Ixodes scapularis]